jgi:hypothetical protein
VDAFCSGPLHRIKRHSDGTTWEIGVIQPAASPMSLNCAILNN